MKFSLCSQPESLPSRKLLFFQISCFFLFIFQLLLIASCFKTLLNHPVIIKTYLLQLSLILFFFHGLELFMNKFHGEKSNKVSPNSNSWVIGKYSEEEVSALVKETIKLVPRSSKNIDVDIVHERATSAWTLISFIWPNILRPSRISLSSGSLHYLSQTEIKAVLLHEIAHNMPRFRVNPFGSLLMTDMSIHCAIFLITYETTPFFSVIAYFVCFRSLLYGIAFALLNDLNKEIEHLCDCFAASLLGKAPIINALLKVGEEDELVEGVISLSAKRLIKCKNLELDDLYLAFNDVRPHGRIFHDNLFKHAAAVLKVTKEDNHESDTSSANEEFRDFLIRRKEEKKRRVRWRSFDKEKKGFLSENEINDLCSELLDFPDKVLVMTGKELYPTTHPGFRERILYINQAMNAPGS